MVEFPAVGSNSNSFRNMAENSAIWSVKLKKNLADMSAKRRGKG